jgi:hypothetical protein
MAKKKIKSVAEQDETIEEQLGESTYASKPEPQSEQEETIEIAQAINCTEFNNLEKYYCKLPGEVPVFRKGNKLFHDADCKIELSYYDTINSRTAEAYKKSGKIY